MEIDWSRVLSQAMLAGLADIAAQARIAQDIQREIEKMRLAIDWKSVLETARSAREQVQIAMPTVEDTVKSLSVQLKPLNTKTMLFPNPLASLATEPLPLVPPHENAHLAKRVEKLERENGDLRKQMRHLELKVAQALPPVWLNDGSDSGDPLRN